MTVNQAFNARGEWGCINDMGDRINLFQSQDGNTRVVITDIERVGEDAWTVEHRTFRPGEDVKVHAFGTPVNGRAIDRIRKRWTEELQEHVDSWLEDEPEED